MNVLWTATQAMGGVPSTISSGCYVPTPVGKTSFPSLPVKTGPKGSFGRSFRNPGESLESGYRPLGRQETPRQEWVEVSRPRRGNTTANKGIAVRGFTDEMADRGSY
jgi:hypothetical protein